MIRRLKLIVILAALISFVASGCSCPVESAATKFRKKEVYVPSDSVVALRGPHALPCWYTEKGVRTRGWVQVSDRWLVGPAAPLPKESEVK